jgi:hypothetical protein
LFDGPQIVATKKRNTKEIAALCFRAPIRPIFIRLPPPKSRCPYTGLSRSALADLCVPNKANRFKPPVKSIAPKKHKYAKRAARLIDFESLMTWLKAQEREEIVV